MKMSIKSIKSSLSVSLKVGTFNKTTVSAENPNIQSTDSLVTAKKRGKRWKLLEITIIAVLILIVLGLMSLPVVFFYLPRVSIVTILEISMKKHYCKKMLYLSGS